MRAFVLVALIGCLPTKPFPCNTDADCARLDRGRCELADGVCSEYAAECDSLHRYAEHSGPKSGTCTPYQPEDEQYLANVCVAGERSPTLHDACGAEVCKSLPACCTSAWSEACVARAEQVCDVDCATRIVAANANRMDVLVRAGADYQVANTLPGNAGRVAWVARDTRPALVLGRGPGITVFAPTGGDAFVTPGDPYNNGTGTLIRGIAAADTNRDGSVEIGLAFTMGEPYVVVLDGGTLKPVSDADRPAQAFAWADFSGDNVPDFAIGTPVGYQLFRWTGSEYRRHRDYLLTGPISSVGWGDVDGDGLLDLVSIGIAVTVHLADGADLRDQESFRSRVFNASDAVGVVGDLDGDLRADVIGFPKPGSGGSELVVFHGWNGTFPAPHKQPSPSMNHVALADVDRDHDLDVIGAVEGGGLVWFENRSTGGAIVLADPQPITAAGAAEWFAVTGW